MKEQLIISSKTGWRQVGDYMVIYSCNTQNLATLNGTASQIWVMINRGSTTPQLVDFLVEEYDIDLCQARVDVKSFVDEMAGMGFILSDNPLGEEAGNDTDGENVLLSIEMEAINRLVPFAVTLETTYLCNERCIHCYMDRNIPSLSTEKLKDIILELAEAGCLFLSLTGGEFFLRPDWQDIIETATDNRFVIDILSNGTLITQEVAQILSKNSVRRVQVSIYGSTSLIHDSVTQIEGSFHRTLRGIEYLRSCGIKVEIAFPLMNINFHDRHNVKALADSFGCLLSPSPIITARNDGNNDTFDLRLTDEQLILFFEDETFSSLYAGRKPFYDHQLYLGIENILDAAPCYCGFNSCAVSPQGIVYPCNQLLSPVGDLKQNRFCDIWCNSLQLKYLRGLTIRELPKCAQCDNLHLCARCPGLALLESGDLLRPSPENCRITECQNGLREKGNEK